MRVMKPELAVSFHADSNPREAREATPPPWHPVTPAEALKRMRADGTSIKAWAESRGFHSSVVYSVLSGRRKCLRGQSHQVAIALGIKASAT